MVEAEESLELTLFFSLPVCISPLSLSLFPPCPDNFCADRIEGFDELGGRDDFTTDALEKRLAKQQVIDFDEMAIVKSLTSKKGPANNKGVASNPNKKAIYASSSNRKADDSDDEDDNEDDD